MDLEIAAAGLRTVNKALYDSAKIFFG